MKKLTCFAIIFLFIFSVNGFAKEKYDLSALRSFNKVMLLVKERYVEPKRIRPKEMFRAAVRAAQNIPEVVVTEPSEDTTMVQIGKKSQTFSLADVNSLWSVSFALRAVAEFIEENVADSVDTKELEYAFANGALSKLDPHSIQLSPPSSQEMKVSTKGQFGGLGIVISIRDRYLTVISPIEGTPAFKVGIKSYDRIIKIDEDSAINMALDVAVERLRGEPGTKVLIVVERKGVPEPIKFVVERAIIKVESVSHHLLDNNIGYVKVKSFQGKTAEDVSAAIKRMRGLAHGELRGLILDLRNNPGGLLDQSVALADLFLDGGVVVVTQGSRPEEREEETAKPGKRKTDLGLVVLVNGGSASASEIVAGAIKNRNRGVIIGVQTFGKATVQMLYDLSDQSSLKLSVAHYLTPGNQSIQSVGITPDIALREVLPDRLFVHAQTREEDLDAHFEGVPISLERPKYDIAYLAEKLTPEEMESRAISSKFVEDFEIKMAKQLFHKASASSREGLLAAAPQLIESVKKSEENRIELALKKNGIDWSSGHEKQQPKLQLSLIDGKKAVAGGVLKLSIQVKNVGTETASKIYGISESKTSMFAGQEFLFGKIAPGKERRSTVEIKIPKDGLTRRDLIRIKLKGVENAEYGRLDIPVVITGLKRPVLAYSYHIENKDGLGDKSLHVGKTSELVMKIRNIGDAVSQEPVALIKNDGGKEIDIIVGGKNLDALKPGQSGEARFSFAVREGEAQVKLRLQLYDAVMNEFWQEKIVLPVLAKNLTQGNSSLERMPEHIPPRISYVGATDAPIVAKGSYQLNMRLSDDTAIKDAIVYVRGGQDERKVFYQAFDSTVPADFALKTEIKLDPGVNVITTVVREDDTYAQSSSITVFSEVGDPLVVQKNVPDAVGDVSPIN